MRKQLVVLLAGLAMSFSYVMAQNEHGNPFRDLGYQVDVYTLTDFEEFHDFKDVVEIGQVLYDTKQKKVVGFVGEKDYRIELIKDVISTSIDPHCEKYPWISPYAYCLNNPVRFIDPDGRDAYEYNMKTKELVWVSDLGGKETQHVDFIDKKGNWSSYASVSGEDVFVYALRDGHVVTNFDANLNDNSYNLNSGYEYSIDDFMMRRELTKDENPIGKYILGQERQGMAEPITRRDAENTYGISLMGLLTITRAMDAALNLTDGTMNNARSLKGFSGTSTLKAGVTPQSSINPWNSFLKANKGNYSGSNWIQQARKDYYNSSYYKR